MAFVLDKLVKMMSVLLLTNLYSHKPKVFAEIQIRGVLKLIQRYLKILNKNKCYDPH